MQFILNFSKYKKKNFLYYEYIHIYCIFNKIKTSQDL